MEKDESITITDRQGKPRKITLKRLSIDDDPCANCIFVDDRYCDCFNLFSPDKNYESLFDWCQSLHNYYPDEDDFDYIPNNLPKDYPELILKYRRSWK